MKLGMLSEELVAICMLSRLEVKGFIDRADD